MKLSLAFRHDPGDLRTIIARVTGAPVHVALLFTYDSGQQCVIEASNSGVRLVTVETAMARGQWTLVPVPMDAENVRRAWEFAYDKVGAKYDWFGVLFAWWVGRPGGNGARQRWFCSELAAGALQAGRQAMGVARYAYWYPRRLWNWCAMWRANA